MPFSDADRLKVIERYSGRFREFGHSEKALGWGEKGKQRLRFELLAAPWRLEGARILDIGAGFGDLYRYLLPFGISSYHGVELVPVLVEKGLELYGQEPGFHLTPGNFLEMDIHDDYDLAFVSGLFNFKLVDGDNYDFIGRTLARALAVCRVGVAANFITDRVDYHEELIFNSRPERILEIALGLTKRVALRHDYFPFEFSIYLYKDDSFSTSDTIFRSFAADR